MAAVRSILAKGVAVMATNPGTCWEYTRRKDHTPREPEMYPAGYRHPNHCRNRFRNYPLRGFQQLQNQGEKHDRQRTDYPALGPGRSGADIHLPKQLTALSGVDVLAHSIEAYINIHASPWVRLVAREAIRLVAAYLPAVVKNGEDHEARQKMAWASTLGGMAIAHANPTLPHALGQAAGGYIHAPHGASVAACLAQILRYQLRVGPKRFAEIAWPWIRMLKISRRKSKRNRRPCWWKDCWMKLRSGSVWRVRDEGRRISTPSPKLH